MTVIALLMAAAVPSIQGIIREHQAREPLREMAEMARAVRKRAMRFQRPYQLGFDAAGCFAAPYFQPYGQAEEYERLRLEQQSRELEGNLAEAAISRFGGRESEEIADPDADFLERYEWPEGMTVRVRFWGDSEWEDLSGARFRRWVFQPTGIARPLVVQFENEGVFLEATFNPLTAEIERERSYVE